MKKLLAILLVLCLVLCGCDAGGGVPTEPNAPGQSGGEHITNPTQSGGETVAPTRPDKEVLTDLDAPALVVKVTINPEFELTLSYSTQILEVKALNADAENLLSGMDLVGKAYGNSMTAILEEAQKQGFLKADAKVSISASELMEGALSAASERILTDPVEAFQETAGITVNSEFAAAGESDFVIVKTHTNQCDGYQEVICYNADGAQVMNKYIYDNGDYRERHFLTDESFFWGNDGTFTYSGSKDGVYTEYTDYPDGTRSTMSKTFDADGNITWSLEQRSDGTTNETFWEYENGVLVHFYSVESSGRTDSYFYDVNGNTTYMLIIDVDGTKIESFYEDGKIVRVFYTNTDGSAQENLYENGECVRIIITEADGTSYDAPVAPGGSDEPVGPQTIHPEGTEFIDTYYDNGNIKTSDIIYPNGDYYKDTYYENGERATEIQQIDGVYIEEHYDENGNCTYSQYKESDGYEQTVTYYSNGNRKRSETTDADGSYSIDTYYENGECASTIIEQDGIYCEMRYDENGRTTYEFYRYPDGTETVYSYENGECTGCTTTYPNGETETIIYE